MRLPAAQAVEREIGIVGGALRFGLRFLTPVSFLFALFTLYLHEGGARSLPEPYSNRSDFIAGEYLATVKATEVSSAVATIALFACMAAALCTMSGTPRHGRRLAWDFAANIIALAVTLFVEFSNAFR